MLVFNLFGVRTTWCTLQILRLRLLQSSKPFLLFLFCQRCHRYDVKLPGRAGIIRIFRAISIILGPSCDANHDFSCFLISASPSAFILLTTPAHPGQGVRLPTCRYLYAHTNLSHAVTHVMHPFSKVFVLGLPYALRYATSGSVRWTVLHPFL